MNRPSLALTLTLMNLALLAFQALRAGTAIAQQPAGILRGRALEIVDERGRVRASITVEPPVSVEGRRHPEAVLLRLSDPVNGPVVKIEASVEGSGLGLSDDTQDGGVRLMAKNRTGSFVEIATGGKRHVIRP